LLSKRSTNEDFTRFVKDTEPKLSYALAAAYGVQPAKEATADAMAYAWEHWEEIKAMDNPAGYLYRVGQTAARKYLLFMRAGPLFPAVDRVELPHVEPGLPAALESLSEPQRIAVVLLHSMDWSEREVAELMDVDRSTVRTHHKRGIAKLRKALEVRSNA
jgi:DNA-directed RNA polymerase specialized sigma24 family protein